MYTPEQQTKCPFTSCELVNSNGASPYTEANVKIGLSPDFEIYGITNNLSGYTDDIKIHCVVEVLGVTINVISKLLTVK